MHSKKILNAVVKDRADGTFCDLDIVCDGVRFQAHRVIVCSQSPIIRAACAGPWKEATSGTFEIKESSPVLIKRMLDFMYSGCYDQGSSGNAVEEDKRLSEELGQLGTACPMVLHARMMALADMYMVDGLGRVALEQVKKLVQQATTSYLLTDCIPEIYALTFGSCRSIRQTLIDSVRERTSQLPLDPDIKGRLDDVMQIVPEFTRELLKSCLYAPLLGHCDRCGRDKTVPVVPLQCNAEHAAGA
ncbi:hypothetical protein E4U43_004228 [Claviceps pusilla]|uniref:BTB domain-containing protein n=1 Tax=Claviceps pusilla TaxID=123648 RepID=A0A9P7N3N4_9HYPO|nr:hypothetical protein E4U43_004228 [Claviceps pusilla]